MIDNTIEEAGLWSKYLKTNDIDLRNRLLDKYRDLANKIALQLAPKYRGHIQVEDLISYANIGLIDAIEKFDLDRGVKFKTYASIRIRGAIIDEIRKLDWVPRSMREKFKVVERGILEIENILGRSATLLEIADHLSMEAKEVDEILSQMNSYVTISMDDKVIEIINERTGSYLQEDILSPEEIAIAEEMSVELANSIDALSQREQLIINLYYYEEFTLKEIGQILGVTESRVSQLHSRALIRLKASLNK